MLQARRRGGAGWLVRFVGSGGLLLIAGLTIGTHAPEQPPTPASTQKLEFMRVGSQRHPSPSPPARVVGHAADGRQVFDWAGKRWLLPPAPTRVWAYLCVNNGLRWCWHNPPDPAARPCTHNGVKGWCRDITVRSPDAPSMAMKADVEKACNRFPNLC